MFRISNRMQYNNTLINAFRNNQGLLQAQERLSSGKRINRPSDDPSGIMQVLSLRTSIGKSDQYLQVMGNADSTLSMADSTLGTVHDVLKSGKELALQQASGTSSALTRATTAVKIDSLVRQLIQNGNTRVGSKYIFSGQRSDQQAIDANGKYTGSEKDLKLEIDLGLTINISVRASEFLTADMNAALSATAGATPVSSLNGGTGVTAGTFNITDRAGTTGAVTVNAGDSIADVITAINAAGTNVTAAVSADGSSITLTDSTAAPSSALIIQDNATSQELGINGSRNSSVFTGNDLDPAITSTTTLGSLYGGNGMTMSDIVISNGGASATVTLSTMTSANTVGDVLTAINAVGATVGNGVTASIDPSGRALTLASGSTSTVSFATDPGTGNTAELLGIGGGRNAIPALQRLSAALKANDLNGILSSITLIDSSMDTASAVRGAVGSVANMVSSTRDSVDKGRFDSTKIKSNIEDTDFLKSVSELAMLQTAYQATLQTSSAIIQRSLLDFIR